MIAATNPFAPIHNSDAFDTVAQGLQDAGLDEVLSDPHIFSTLVAAVGMKVKWIPRMAEQLAETNISTASLLYTLQEKVLQNYSTTTTISTINASHPAERRCGNVAAMAHHQRFLKDLVKVNTALPLTVGCSEYDDGSFRSCIEHVAPLLVDDVGTLLVTGDIPNLAALINGTFGTTFDTRPREPLSEIAVVANESRPYNIINCVDLPDPVLLSPDSTHALCIRKMLVCVSYPLATETIDALKTLIDHATNVNVSVVVAVMRPAEPAPPRFANRQSQAVPQQQEQPRSWLGGWFGSRAPQGTPTDETILGSVTSSVLGGCDIESMAIIQSDTTTNNFRRVFNLIGTVSAPRQVDGASNRNTSQKKKVAEIQSLLAQHQVQQE